MRSRVSFCRKELIVNNFRMYGVLSGLWGIYLFLVYPVLLVNYKYEMTVESLSKYLFSPITFIPFLMPLVGAMILFHFLKTDNGVAFHMSLPATKTQIFFSQFVSGFLLYTIPLLINFGLMAMYCFIRIEENKELLPLMLGQWLLYMILIFVVNFFISTAIGMVTGSTIWQIIFTGIFFGLPSYFNYAGIFFGHQLLRGFANESPWYEFFRSIDMIRRLFFDYYYRWEGEKTYRETVIFLVVYSVVAFVVAYLLYRFKKMESNREWVSFRPIKIIFIIGFTTCMVILISAFFSVILFQNQQKIAFYGGAALGAVLGYIISAMIVWKTIYLKKAWLGVFASLALTIGILGAIDIDLFGFESYIPKIEEIEAISLGSNYYSVAETELSELITIGEDPGYRKESVYFEEPENIEHIRQLHQNIILNKYGKLVENGNQRHSFLTISYHLKDGSEIKRDYGYYMNIQDDPVYQKLMESDEVIRKRYVVLDDKKMKKAVGIKIKTEIGRTEETFTGKEMKELAVILQEEIRMAADGTEKLENRDDGSIKLMLQKQIPIRVRIVMENKKTNQDSMSDDKRFRGEGWRLSEGEEYSYDFYGEVPKLREWLKRNSNVLDVELDKDEIKKLVFYEVPSYEFYRFEDWARFYQEKEMYEEPIAEVTAKEEFDKYLALSGKPIRFSSDKKIVVLIIKLKNEIDCVRGILQEDYQQIAQ